LAARVRTGEIEDDALAEFAEEYAQAQKSFRKKDA
jgi:hypothetical protein